MSRSGSCGFTPRKIKLREFGKICFHLISQVFVRMDILNVGKNSRGRKGRGKMARKKRPREKMANRTNGRWKKAEGKKRKNNNLKSNFSATADIFVRIFFYDY